MKKAHFLSNYFNLGILALSGFIANIVCDFYFGSSLVGTLNTSTSIYLILTQCAAWGQQIYLQSQLPLCSSHQHIKDKITLSTYSSLVTSALFSIAAVTLTIIFSKPEYTFLALTTFFMGPTKTLTFAQLGLGEYHKFAICNSARSLFFLFSIVLLGTFDQPNLLGLSFLVAELLTLAVSVALTLKNINMIPPATREISNNIQHNFANFLSIMVMELNTRLDIIVISLLGSKEQVAIYSVALIFFEGFYQALVVIRNIISKTLTKLHFSSSNELKLFAKQTAKKVYLFAMVMGIGAFVTIPWLIKIYKNQDLYSESIPLAYTVIAVQTALAGLLVFDNFLGVINRPQLYLKQKSFILLLNLVAQPVFFLSMGLMGSAIATSLSYLCSAALNYLAIRTARAAA
ncbi:hypothetical protein ACES2J_07730 [Bdellovibrio bacteriovorus]|uniref:hypothetical protein n=1 Tax=Bdellovibrio bacteriovorus TaxID=959 RepID=UPI0035A62DAA